jgi:hypothetical protein
VSSTLPPYDGLTAFHGDLHNHCGISYGHGTIEDAYANARAQLDFASVTAHAHWPDIPVRDPRLADLVAYHQEGFRRAARLWPHIQDVTEAVHEDGRFASFLSFEWHSLRYGDHCVYYSGPRGEIIRAADLDDLRAHLRALAARGVSCFMIPHHIAYLAGRRGLRWEAFTPEFTPVVEMVSMHGLAESDEGPFPYLHTMGPRDGRSTMQHGLRLGHVFGVIGSSDHHSAHPGSHGHGRLAVWADALTRQSVWEAIAARRTYATTGDRIELAVALNGHPMGAVLPAAAEREIEVAVVGGGALDHVEVLRNNAPLYRWSARAVEPAASGRRKVHLELGWGPRDRDVEWAGHLEVVGGRLLAVEPRFRGLAVVSPQKTEPPPSDAPPAAASPATRTRYAFSSWERSGPAGVRFATRTWGNPTTTTPSTQGLCLEIDGEASTEIRGRINERAVSVTLGDLAEGARAGYLGGFRTPAWCFHRAVPEEESTCRFAVRDRARGDRGGAPGRDWYYVRVCQRNGQWAWSSAIWMGGLEGPPMSPGARGSPAEPGRPSGALGDSARSLGGHRSG